MPASISWVAVASARSTRIFPAPLYRAPLSSPLQRRRPGLANTTVFRHRARDARTLFRWSPTCIAANQADSRPGRLLGARSSPLSSVQLFTRAHSRPLVRVRSHYHALSSSFRCVPLHCIQLNPSGRPHALSHSITRPLVCPLTLPCLLSAHPDGSRAIRREHDNDRLQNDSDLPPMSASDPARHRTNSSRLRMTSFVYL